MNQPTPQVTQHDVERIVMRDFDRDSFAIVMSLLNEYGQSEGKRETCRVRLAALKMANGRVEELKRQIEWAKCDYRDVIAAVEYPMSMKKRGVLKNCPEQERDKIIEQDWKQYTDWLNRK